MRIGEPSGPPCRMEGGFVWSPPPIGMADCVELLKPRVSAVAAMTAGVGFCIAPAPGGIHLAGLLHTLLATMALSSGAVALNQYLERDVDAMMARTRNRPLAAGRMSPRAGLYAGVLLSVAGLVYLCDASGAMAGMLGLGALIMYVLVYTPLKLRTSLATVVGAVPGALPPLIGWAAACGRLDLRALSLFTVMFAWQFSHCLPIAWLHREDCRRAGLPLFGGFTQSDRVSLGHVGVCSALLFAAALTPSVVGLAGPLYFTGAVASCVVFAALSYRWGKQPCLSSARWVFIGSLCHLVLLFALLFAGRGAC